MTLCFVYRWFVFFVYIACDVCVLTFEFYVVSFPFSVLCYVFLDRDLSFRRLDVIKRFSF